MGKARVIDDDIENLTRQLGRHIRSIGHIKRQRMGHTARIRAFMDFMAGALMAEVDLLEGRAG